MLCCGVVRAAEHLDPIPGLTPLQHSRNAALTPLHAAAYCPHAPPFPPLRLT